MGIALGCIHLSLDDFLRLRTDEFEAVGKAYYSERDALFRDQWERSRMHACICVQPHTKNRITPQSLLPFPWEQSTPPDDAPTMTPEEQRQRMRELVERLSHNTKKNNGRE